MLKSTTTRSNLRIKLGPSSSQVQLILLTLCSLFAYSCSISSLPAASHMFYLSTSGSMTADWQNGGCSSIVSSCSPQLVSSWSIPDSTVYEFFLVPGIYDSAAVFNLGPNSTIIFSGNRSEGVHQLTITVASRGDVSDPNIKRSVFFSSLTLTGSGSFNSLILSSLTDVQIQSTSLNHMKLISTNLRTLSIVSSTWITSSTSSNIITFQTNSAFYNLPHTLHLSRAFFSCAATSPSFCASIVKISVDSLATNPDSMPFVEFILESTLVNAFPSITTLDTSKSLLPIMNYVLNASSNINFLSSPGRPLFDASSTAGVLNGARNTFTCNVCTIFGLTERTMPLQPPLLPSNASVNLNFYQLSATRIMYHALPSISCTLTIELSTFVDSLVTIGPNQAAYIMNSFFIAKRTDLTYSSLRILLSEVTLNNLAIIDDNSTISASAPPNLVLAPDSVVKAPTGLVVDRLGVCNTATISGNLTLRKSMSGKVATYDSNGLLETLLNDIPFAPSNGLISPDATLSSTAIYDQTLWILHDRVNVSAVTIRNLIALKFLATGLPHAPHLFATNLMPPFSGVVTPKVSIAWTPSTPPDDLPDPQLLMVSDNVPFSSLPSLDTYRSTKTLHFGWFDGATGNVSYHAAASLPASQRMMIAYVMGSAPPIAEESPCTLPKPRPEALFTCSPTGWITTGALNSSTSIAVSSPIIVSGNFTAASVVITGLDSVIDILGCASLPHVITIILTPEEYQSLKSNSTRFADLFKAECFSSDNFNVTLNVKTTGNKKDCEKLSGSTLFSDRILTGVFVLDTSNCKVSGSKTWWIVLAAVLGGVVLIIIILTLVFTLSPSARRLVRPYTAREGLRNESSIKS